MSDLRVFTFSPGWGLPTTGPFALKLLAWLAHHRIAYRQVIENVASKGPLGKSPWIELEGERIGDSDAIIRLLADRHDIELEAGGTPGDRAVGHAFKTAFEERFHQILEWELFVHREGAAFMDAFIRGMAPPVVGALVSRSMRRHFARQLHARGIARHAPATIAAMGRADLDALAALLADRRFIAGEEPGLADFAVFGQVAPLLHWPMRTPVAEYAKSIPVLGAWSARLLEDCAISSTISANAAARPAGRRAPDATPSARGLPAG